MGGQTWPLLCQLCGWSLPESRLALCLCRGVLQECPGPLTSQRPLGLPLLARELQQATAGLATVAGACVVGPREARHVRAMAQPRPLAPTDGVQVTAKRLACRWEPWLPRYRTASTAALRCDVRGTAGARGHGVSEVGDGPEPGRPLLPGGIGLGPRRERGLEALGHVG